MPDSVRETLSSPGRPLDHATRLSMQSHFFHQFGALRRATTAQIQTLPNRVYLSMPGDAVENEAEALSLGAGNRATHATLDSPDAGPDFGGIRLHTDALAARSAHALGTHAYAFGQHVVIDGSRYAPGTSSGARLLAHELAHTLQTAPAGALMLMRDKPTGPQPTTSNAPQGSVSMSVSMDGLRFEFPGSVFQQGSSRQQIMAMILRRLVGEQYKAGLEDKVLAALDKTTAVFKGALSRDSKVKSGDAMGVATVDLGATVTLVKTIVDLQMRHTLTSAQVDLLYNGFAAHAAWDQLHDEFPSWYTEWIFKREMAQHGELLADWRAAWQNKPGADGVLAINKIEGVLLTGAMLVDTIREDVALANETLKPTNDIVEKRNRESAAAAYAIMFNLTLSTTPITKIPVDVDEAMAANFLRYIHSQEKLAAQASADGPDGHDARTKLLGRFGRFWVRGQSSGTDEKILREPARANTPPWKAELSSTPPAAPPLYEAALETDHAFTMQLQWTHFTDAMVRYSYLWDFIRVPDSMLGDPAADPLQAAGEKPSFGKVLNTRLARARRYNAADLDRIHQRLGGTPFGQAAEDLVQANAALRYVGTIIHTLLDKITEPSYVTRYVFPGAGMYIVRCRALPVLDGEEETVRLPSIAFVPIVARDADEMAVGQVKDATRTQFQARLRMAEIQSLLASPFPPENATALREELQDLQAMLLDPKEALEHRKEALDKQISLLQSRLDLRKRIAAIMDQPEAQRDAAALAKLQSDLMAAGGESGNAWDEERTLSSLTAQRDSAQDMLTMHAERTKDERGIRFAPLVTFVSDLGQSLQLSIEMFDRGEGDGVYQVFMSDLTTPDSGKMLGTAPMTGKNPRVDAIKDGLKRLLEESSDYGRGRVAVQIDGQVHLVSIQAGTGRMLTEAAESAAMVASLAAIVAAPITDGASLFLLLPLGAAGAVTSAYRLYQRYDENRLRLDFAAVMDVVNIVGGVLGLAQVATPLRAVRLGKVLMVMGIGVDGAGIMMMGAGVMVQLDALSSLPEHERAARMLEILGQAMLQIGIQAGGAVMHARYQSHRGATGGHEIEPGSTQHDEPGFHSPPPDELAKSSTQTTNPADRSMTGSGGSASDGKPPSSPPPGTTTTSATPKGRGSPEHLFDRLEKGVDRSLPPPLPAEAIKNPPKAGEFQRGLTTADAAYAAYNKALAVSGGREVAIYHNPETGEYRIMMGSETGVRAPEPFGWNALLHYHPNEGNVLNFRLPAPQDFAGLMMRYLSGGVAVREFVEFNIPGVGRGRTEYGMEPGNPEPFYVRINQADGTSRTVRFANDGHYSAYWGERTIAVPEGSPVYDAMIRDIQDYIRSIRGSEPQRFGPDEKTSSGSTTETKPPTETTTGPADKTMAKKTTGTSADPLQSGVGDLTDRGVAFLRRKFRTVRNSEGKSVELATLTDAQIKEQYANQAHWVEAVVLAEVRGSWLGRETTTDFVMSDPKQTLDDVAKKLGDAAMAGKTGHSLNTAILGWSVMDFVGEMLRQADPTLTPAYNACENSTNPNVKRQWKEFKTSAAAGDMSGFFLGRVGSKRPDVVEVMLSQNEIHITDATLAYENLIHNFKSAFYKTVIERLINVGTVTSTDYRAPLKQTPIGP
ncbi:DUF4157 domain-containing protein [Dyella subtropica]|uniref:eCIS core domain-containing protein n=1 Tax=Dyella subtropica TaxID=2992127 RepID=UPI00225BF123|nr:DUF4157 domain-containing protein [Dyella subtropica]